MIEDGVFGKLLIIYPDRSRREVGINEPEFRIGSDPQAHLVITAPGIGRVHAVLLATSQGLQLQSPAPESVVLVNQQPVNQRYLEQGDVITLGPFMLVYHRAAPELVRGGMPPSLPSAGFPAAVPAAGSLPTPISTATRIPASEAAVSPAAAATAPPGSAPGIQSSSGVALVVYSPTGTFSYPLEPGRPVRLGTTFDNEVVLNFAPGVKPLHARLDWRDAEAVVIDPDGRGDIQVNGKAETERILRNGDFVKLGEARLVYHDTRTMEGMNTPLKQVVSGGLNRSTLGQVVKIGRDATNEISLNHIQISRYHAEIQRRSDGYYLVDLGSTNGTFLNGVRIKEAEPLHKGDRIRISDFTFFFDGAKLEHFSEEGNARIDAINLRRIVANNKVILHDVSLSIYPREFVALVGVSGAGKSTLMNALSGFRPADQGTVLLNGTDYYAHFDSFRSTLGYVPQDDIIHKELTVYRALYYAACLRMPEDTSPQEIHQRLEDVMKDLHLADRRDTPIAKLSGGQRKRVSIGVELITRPRLFYLDEPTSGLDPGMETEMMRIFRNLADKGHTLILVTHATKNIMMCDKVIFLAEGGHLAFYGSPAEALTYFGTADFTDIYLKLENEKTPETWDKEYRASTYYRHNVIDRLKEVNSLVEKARTQEQQQKDHQNKGGRVSDRGKSALRQFSILTGRYLEIIVRDRGNLGILLGSAAIIAIIIALIFGPDIMSHFQITDYTVPGPPGTVGNFSAGPNKLEVINDNAFKARLMTFFLMMAAIFFGVNSSIREIAKEIPIYKRERTVNLQIPPYIFSKVFVLSVICAVQVLILELIIAGRFRFPNASWDFYVHMFLVLFMSSLAAMAMGLAFSAFASNENKANSALPILLMPQLLLTGSMPKLPWPEKIVSYFGLSKWSFEILGNLTEIWKLFPSDEQANARPGLMVVLQKLVDQGKDFQDQLNIQYWRHLGMLGLFLVVFLALACTFQLGKDEIKR